MAEENPSNSPPLTSSIDPNCGFCSKTEVYHSLRPSPPLPPETTPLSITSYVLSFLRHPTNTAALIDAATGHRILQSEIRPRVKSLAFCLRQKTGLCKGDTAFILSVNSPEIPMLYLSLFSLGVIVSPSNPANSAFEISHQIQLTKPVIAFATSDIAHKLPSSLSRATHLLDSPEFSSMMLTTLDEYAFEVPSSEIYQSDTAAVIYSSGTTGSFKGVELTHRNFISVLSGEHAARPLRQSPPVFLCTVPFFHIYGFLLSFREVALGGTVISMKRFDLRLMMRTVEEFRVTHLALAPPVVVSMVNNVHVAKGYELSSLEVVFCGGAPLTSSAIERFKRMFPNVDIAQAYGLTETTGGATRTRGPAESQRLGAVGRLISYCQAKIVDPETGDALPPVKPGELWLRGPTVMKGYLANKEATAATINLEGWLRTGDICYFDNEGFLFYVERIKELIKYKGYQVAPSELEQLLLSHPDINDSAVVPYPDEGAGQIPVAFVVRKSGSSIDGWQIMDFITKQVAPYKKIRKVFFVNSIPKNAPGKVLRKELIKLAMSNPASKL